MSIRGAHGACSPWRHLRLTLTVSVVLSVVLGCTGSCRKRPESLSTAAKALLDSSLAGNEALYDSSTANIAMDRLSCLEYRASRVLGRDQVRRISRQAEQTVRARHSRAEFAAGERGIEMFHEMPEEATCKGIDSLWYTMVVKPRRAHP